MCEYKGRRYFVRDNGAVYRQCQKDGRIMKWDEEWTFGKFDSKTGYMLISQERVHRIVCTAYHGEPVGDRNVVDHIDTNRCNNRPENLRWVSKLENTLNNPITRAKVEIICGSVEAFLEDPSLLYGHESENPNFKWMRAVTKEEAERSLKRWNEWAAKPVEERTPQGKGVGEWIYEKDKTREGTKLKWRFRYLGPYKSYAEQMVVVEEMNRIEHEKQYGLKNSLTPGAKQLDWKTPTEFLQTPQEISSTPIEDYYSCLSKGTLYCRNQYGDSLVFEAAMAKDGDHLVVVTEIPGVTNYALSAVTFSDGVFVHRNLGSFLTEEEAMEVFTESVEGRLGDDAMESYY